MPMFARLFGNHSENLRQAMGATSQRHTLLTRNLANVNVPGYKRQDMEFGIRLQEAQSNNRPGERVARLRDRMAEAQNRTGSVRIDRNSVDLETEVMSIAEMEIRYQLLTEITSRHFSGLRSVIREGR